MSKKDVEKATTRVSGDYNKQEEVRTGPTPSSSSSLSEQRHSFNRAIDETNENIKRSIEEARREIPRNTQAFNDYEEQTLQAAKEISESYLESQKEIISSFQSAWIHILRTTIIYGITGHLQEGQQKDMQEQ